MCFIYENQGLSKRKLFLEIVILLIVLYSVYDLICTQEEKWPSKHGDLQRVLTNYINFCKSFMLNFGLHTWKEEKKIQR